MDVERMELFPRINSLRSVDYVLAWDNRFSSESPSAFEQRRIFELNLESVGLLLEREPPYQSVNFIKIQAPVTVLKQYCEKMSLRMRIKETLKDEKPVEKGLQKIIDACWYQFKSPLELDKSIFPSLKQYMTACYSEVVEELFDTSSDDFWIPSVRSAVVQYILNSVAFTDQATETIEFGVDRMIANNVYSDAYAVYNDDTNTESLRFRLHYEWASIFKTLDCQPLDHIKELLGGRVALYFAWRGFYSRMLLAPTFVGLLCISYSALTALSEKSIQSICNSTTIMCPVTGRHDYWLLKDVCSKKLVAYIFDNPATLIFTMFMGIWAGLYNKMWMRYAADMIHRWDLIGEDSYHRHLRIEYMSWLRNDGNNGGNGSFMKNVLRNESCMRVYAVYTAVAVLAILTVLLMVTVDVFVTSASAFINLFLIIVLKYLYQYVAKWLTDKQMLRTQFEYDNSLAWKTVILEAASCYGFLLYIGLIKGKFVGEPGNYVKIFGMRLQECAPEGCFFELLSKFVVIAVGKLVINGLFELIKFWLLKWATKKRKINLKLIRLIPTQWMIDLNLLQFDNMTLFPYYQEMVIQFGFLTVFASVFPIGPLIALIMNMFMIRLEAMILITCYRRPVTPRVNDLKIWMRLIVGMSIFTGLINAGILGLTSELVPRIMFEKNMAEFMSEFQRTGLENAPNVTKYGGTSCNYFNDFLNTDWLYMTPRLVVIVLFLSIVVSTINIILCLWSTNYDVSQVLFDRIQQESKIVNTHILARGYDKWKTAQQANSDECQDQTYRRPTAQ